MTEVTINLNVSGLSTAEQIRGQVASKRQDSIAARTLMLDRHAAEQTASDEEIALFDARMGELDAFIAFAKAAQGG